MNKQSVSEYRAMNRLGLFIVMVVCSLGLVSQAAEAPLKVKVAIQAPASNYAIKVTGVYQVKKEIWVVSQISKMGDFGAAVITTISDEIVIENENLPTDAKDKVLPIKYKVLGKTWNWGKNTAYLEYIPKKDEAKFKKMISKANKIPFKRVKKK